MDRTRLRRDIARLLSEARVKAAELGAATGDGVLLYFIQMSIVEVLAQQADAMEAGKHVVAREGAPPPAAQALN